jgi:hypothetical protein
MGWLRAEIELQGLVGHDLVSSTLDAHVRDQLIIIRTTN